MKDTRENILLVSLRLFAQEGYEAVSVSQIAGELGLTKGALYRHYANKQAIFESILQKMEQLDAERAQAFELPEGTVQDMPQSYEIATPEALCAFSKAQFRYWAQDEFAAPFRRMLTIEQYRNEQMAALYSSIWRAGRLAMCGICWRQWALPTRKTRPWPAMRPLLALLGVYDGAADRQAVLQAVDAFYDDWLDRVRKEGRTSEFHQDRAAKKSGLTHEMRALKKKDD